MESLSSLAGRRIRLDLQVRLERLPDLLPVQRLAVLAEQVGDGWHYPAGDRGCSHRKAGKPDA